MCVCVCACVCVCVCVCVCYPNWINFFNGAVSLIEYNKVIIRNVLEQCVCVCVCVCVCILSHCYCPNAALVVCLPGWWDGCVLLLCLLLHGGLQVQTVQESHWENCEYTFFWTHRLNWAQRTELITKKQKNSVAATNGYIVWLGVWLGKHSRQFALRLAFVVTFVPG